MDILIKSMKFGVMIIFSLILLYAEHEVSIRSTVSGHYIEW